MITGIAVGGFGAGALITAPVATRLIQTVGVLHTFAYLGIAFLIVTLISGSFMQNPRVDRGAEQRKANHARSAFVPLDALQRDPHFEMHTRGG